MVSDGVLDALPGEDKEETMKEYLENLERKNPQDMAGEDPSSDDGNRWRRTG